MKYIRRAAGYTWTDCKTNARIAKELKITPILDNLLEYKRSWIQHVNRMPRNRLPRVMKHYSPTGRRNRGRPLKSLLGTWDWNGSRSGPTAWQIMMMMTLKTVTSNQGSGTTPNVRNIVIIGRKFKLETSQSPALPSLPKCVGWATSKFTLQQATLQWSNPSEGEIFRTRPDGPWGPPNLLYVGYRFFPGGKAVAAWRWPPTPYNPEVQERVELYF